jgi:dipeptidase E
MGVDFDRLVRALPAGAAVGVISNAVDFVPQKDRIDYARNVFDPVQLFRRHGLAARELDLRGYFGRQEALRAATEDLRLVWANGGNAFLLRRAMRQSGMDDLLSERVQSGATIYGGWSAGAVIAGPTLRGSI